MITATTALALTAYAAMALSPAQYAMAASTSIGPDTPCRVLQALIDAHDPFVNQESLTVAKRLLWDNDTQHVLNRNNEQQVMVWASLGFTICHEYQTLTVRQSMAAAYAKYAPGVAEVQAQQRAITTSQQRQRQELYDRAMKNREQIMKDQRQ